MSTIKYLFTQNDTDPDLTETLKDASGVPLNLTGATVEFHMRSPFAATYKVKAAAVIENAVSGIVRYAWQAADLNTAGVFLCEWQVTVSGGGVQTSESFYI